MRIVTKNITGELLNLQETTTSLNQEHTSRAEMKDLAEVMTRQQQEIKTEADIIQKKVKILP